MFAIPTVIFSTMRYLRIWTRVRDFLTTLVKIEIDICLLALTII